MQEIEKLGNKLFDARYGTEFFICVSSLPANNYFHLKVKRLYLKGIILSVTLR
jgi:hypothetical protein